MDGFDGDWVHNARELMRRRHPAALAGERTVQRKAADFLLRRGFAMEHVQAALRDTANE
jgi:regulatory protein